MTWSSSLEDGSNDLNVYPSYLVLTIDPDMISPQKIILREAVYNAISLNALALYDQVDFDLWLTTVIPAELAYNGPQYSST
jgi:hypothetical protein